MLQDRNPTFLHETLGHDDDAHHTKFHVERISVSEDIVQTKVLHTDNLISIITPPPTMPCPGWEI